jgi:hypothetical protein
MYVLLNYLTDFIDLIMLRTIGLYVNNYNL